jgi:hypothetical protein
MQLCAQLGTAWAADVQSTVEQLLPLKPIDPLGLLVG